MQSLTKLIHKAQLLLFRACLLLGLLITKATTLKRLAQTRFCTPHLNPKLDLERKRALPLRTFPCNRIGLYPQLQYTPSKTFLFRILLTQLGATTSLICRPPIHRLPLVRISNLTTHRHSTRSTHLSFLLNHHLTKPGQQQEVQAVPLLRLKSALVMQSVQIRLSMVVKKRATEEPLCKSHHLEQEKKTRGIMIRWTAVEMHRESRDRAHAHSIALQTRRRSLTFRHKKDHLGPGEKISELLTQ